MDGFDFCQFPTLTTRRLALREIVERDAEDLLAFCGDPEVLQYDVDPPLQSAVDALWLIDDFRRGFRERKAIHWGVCLRAEDRVIGLFAFYLAPADGQAHLGYRLARLYWRQGIAAEAARAMVAFGFERLGLHRINVDTRMDNIASVRLMERLGFVHEGTRRECGRSPDGSYHSWGLYGLLEQEYQPE